MSNPRYGSGRKQFVGQGIEADLGKLDPAAYPGAVAYSDGELYYSDGSEWVVPQDEVDIARPRNLAPTNGVEQAQLRLSAFRSPTGETQTGVIFEINTDGLPNFGEGANLITRNITSEVASLYDVQYPDDGFQPGDTIWWRARYLGTNGTQSQYSIPTAQTFPDLITTPTPVTPSNAITGTVTLSPFESAPIFGLQYYQTQVEFYAVGAVVGVDTPVTTVTQTSGAITTTPIPPLVAGQTYQWRGRYTGRVNAGSPTVTSAWSTSRTIFLGAASIVLEYDMDFVVSRTIQIPLGTAAPAGEPYSVTVDWGDGTSQVFTTGGIKSKTYAVGFTPTGGRFTVTISGRMTSYGTTSISNQPGLVRVENIGFSMGLTSLQGAFARTTLALEYVTPNMPETITNVSSLFEDSTQNCAALSNLDTRNFTNTSRMFWYNLAFNRDIGAWDVSKVTNMTTMFYLAGAFNNGGSDSINNWNTASLTLAGNLFAGCGSFNQPVGNWDMSKVTVANDMFGGCSTFNQNLGAWDVSSLVNAGGMFSSATSFNNGGSPSINNWNTSNVTNMASMFRVAYAFNQPIGNWDLSKVTSIAEMFLAATVFNQNIGAWNTANLTSLYLTFGQASAFNQNIGAWDVSKVTSMYGTFQQAFAFNNGGSTSINNWNTGAVTSMFRLFFQAYAFNQPVGNWDVSKVTDFGALFELATAFNQDINNWNVSSGTSFFVMLSQTAFNRSIGGWTLRPAGITNFMLNMSAVNEENYSRTLIGWANYVASTDGPYAVPLIVTATRLYNANNYVTGQRFNNAVAARAFLVGGRIVSVTGASDANANTTYTYNGTTQTYDAANGWKFAVLGSSWGLYDASAVLQATGSGGGIGTGPHVTTSWTGVLSAATVLRTGASWTITGDAAA